jgi:hypothetical protein
MPIIASLQLRSHHPAEPSRGGRHPSPLSALTHGLGVLVAAGADLLVQVDPSSHT